MAEENQNQEVELSDEELERRLSARGSFLNRVTGTPNTSENIVVSQKTEQTLKTEKLVETHRDLIETEQIKVVPVVETVVLEKIVPENGNVLNLKNTEVEKTVETNRNLIETHRDSIETEKNQNTETGKLVETRGDSIEINNVAENAASKFTAEDAALEFPDGFLWGVSTSAYQIEGGIVNDWSVWEQSPKRLKKLHKQHLNPEDFISGKGCDSYHRYEEDFDLAAGIGANSFRLGIEWARIEPNQGTLVVSEINHYIDVLKAAKKRGLKTVVTLWHWTLPLWVAEMGGWSNEETIECFQKYTDIIVREMGGYIDYWVTLNEPMMHVMAGYVAGYFPPNKHSIFKSQKVFNNLVSGHIAAYQKIHYHFPAAQVSIAQIVNHIEPANKFNLLEWAISGIYHYWWNHRFLARTKKYLDFVGVDYYFHHRIIWRPPFKKIKSVRTSDLGWEIYPEGIYHVLKYLQEFKKPIIILENGIADANDRFRADFLREHLHFVHKAIQEGADVRGYFHWSLLDNFEWALGWAPKFGLVEVDRKTGERKLRPSAEIFKKFATRKNA